MIRICKAHFIHYSKAAKSGVVAWDCKDQEEVLLIPDALFFGGDNPMHAEECSQAGLNCNYFCRTCHIGGTKQYKESDDGYLTVFEVYCSWFCPCTILTFSIPVWHTSYARRNKTRDQDPI